MVVALESTSYYGIHIANYLSSCEELLPFKTLVYCLKVLYEPLTVAIASSFNLITAYNHELKAINAAIEKSIKGLDLNSYTALQSIPGIGPAFAAGILSELGNIHSFKDNGAISKYAGLVWRESQSGNFRAEDTAMSKAGNTYLRYYLLEATNSVIRHEPSFKKYHDRKFEEVKIHKHQRALALTARKFVRLIYGLLAKGQLY